MNSLRERNIGIDLLKILAMIMIICHHILVHGGILKWIEQYSAKYYLFWYLEIACFCAVNCYAMASGFLLYKSRFKFSRILNLYLQVWFYSIIILGIFYIFNSSKITIEMLKSSLFPFSFQSYWYFTAYIAVAFLSPLLNKLIDILSKKQFEYLLIFNIIIFSIIPTAISRDMMYTNDGYSALWLIVLYLFGVYIKKYSNEIKHIVKYIIYYIISITLVFISKYIIQKTGINVLDVVNPSDYLIKYTSPFILAASIFLFKFFMNIKLKWEYLNKPLIALSTATFGVYLIHENVFIRQEIIRIMFLPYIELSTIKLLSVVLIGLIIIYIYCSVIEIIRRGLFKLLRIDNLTIKLDKFSDNIFYNKKDRKEQNI